MQRSIGQAASPEIEQLVHGLLREDANYDNHENRSAHREHLVRSVTIQIRRPTEEVIPAFSRNVSASGIGLITDTEVTDRSIALLVIERLKGSTAELLAECRWCKPYGENWHISGWHFITIQS